MSPNCGQACGPRFERSWGPYLQTCSHVESSHVGCEEQVSPQMVGEEPTQVA